MEEGEDQKIIEELDSLWWFSNIFSSSTPQQQQLEVTIDSEAASVVVVTEEINEKKKMMTETTYFMEEKEEEDTLHLRSDEEKKPIPEIHSETEQVVHESSYTDSEVETSSEFGSLSESDFEDFEDFESESELHGMRTSVILKEEERNRRINGSQKFGDLRFDFGDIGLDLMLVPMIPRLPRSRSGNNPYLVSKMPPLSDGMAMKKHLKLWAHAVACNVR